MNAPGGGNMKQCAAEMVETAAQAGMERPWDILALSPAEIELQFRALAAKRQA